MKIYCIISKESLLRMKGIRGKMMAQAGHAFLHSYWNSEHRFPQIAEQYRAAPHARKITLVVDTDDQLKELYAFYEEKCGVTIVIDAGFTVFDEPTLTCIGIGPIPDDHVHDNIKQLKLLS